MYLLLKKNQRSVESMYIQRYKKMWQVSHFFLNFWHNLLTFYEYLIMANLPVSDIGKNKLYAG